MMDRSEHCLLIPLGNKFLCSFSKLEMLEPEGKKNVISNVSRSFY